uniref:NADH dehydrogenase subunit 6 n=1 Tax=Blepharipoda liberata TaxID=1514702 RepID=UPI002182424A|nr:NADH dehydrogenase subunit 6 [Blepharipoda liberata]UVN15677.1 NADH dehydrogenase subunit 6 [Blepharipoda liberata]
MTLPTIILLSILFLRLLHPLTMGLTLLFQTVLISISSGLILKSFWFSYILFLIFLGGMLVLFIYVASLAPNEQFKSNLTTTMLAIFMWFMLTCVIMFLDPMTMSNKMMIPTSTLQISDKISLSNIMTSFIYNSPSAMTTFFIISYLLLALVVIVKVISVNSKSLRLML